MLLHNTYTKKLEEFKPIEKGKVGIYSCGPTVYDFVHIGNLRTFLLADFLRRSFIYSGYEVKHIKNITDVGHLTQDDIEAGEDKMIKAAKREKKNPYDIARFYEQAFYKDERKLNILPAYKFPRATEYIKEMIAMVEKLIKNGYAYETNGSVFYDIAKFKDYGKLSGNTLENLKACARLEKHPDKKNFHDFALWLKASPEHLMQWDSPWSKGYPGWHIECSAMSVANLGNTMDIHTGGEDNIFPHHEDEIAQSEGATGKKFVNYWVHGRHLLVDKEKMSKSKGNFYVLADIEKRGFNPLSFRYLCLTAHYQSQLNFTWQSLRASENALNKLSDFIVAPPLSKGAGRISSQRKLGGFLEKFQKALENNLDTPKALAIIWEMIKSKELSYDNKKRNLLKFDQVLGLDLDKIKKEDVKISEKIKDLIKQREEARKNKDWQKADELRDEIKKGGYAVQDMPVG
ncbi:MAG: cysteine--tRNA ligase [Patescibacteria group bacterium]|nr:cysteine--tRNA ligase [Patescibacteria group bacterium]